ncbi:MAG: nucleotidyl transferase AbiEii/AbiGii toxin family protein [Methanosarcinales archaeon]
MEKDYVLTILLKEIYLSQFKKIMVFKGGTALHKLYLHKRISMDLDFTAIGNIDIEEFKKVIIFPEINAEIKNIEEFSDAITIKLNYIGVLKFKNSVKLDISLREKPLLPLVNLVLETPYFEPFEITTFHLKEISAEKLRATIQRKKPRDYFDIYLLLKNFEIQDLQELTKKKMDAVNRVYDLNSIFESLDDVQTLWKQDLIELVPELIDFNEVITFLRKKLC